MKTENPKILIVDDRRENLFALKKILQKIDVEVHEVDSGNDALLMVLKHKYALILLDVQMPGISGFEVAELMKDNDETKEIPIIFLTAIDRDDTRAMNGYHVGCVDFIFKPLNEEVLLSKVKVFLEIYKSKFELKAKIKEISDIQEKLIESAQLASLGQMAGGIAHEINNPIAIVSSSMLIIKRSVSKEKINKELVFEHVKKVELTLGRIVKIIHGLRTISREFKSFKKDIVEVSELFSDVYGLCSERFKNSDIHISDNFSDISTPKLINCDQVQLSQVLINLLCNSYDAIEELPERWIKIELNKVDEANIIKIIDSGSGIPIEIQEKMFRPFYTSKEVGKGTGLGLSLSKTIVEKHGGSLNIGTENGNTCFTISIPVSINKLELVPEKELGDA